MGQTNSLLYRMPSTILEDEKVVRETGRVDRKVERDAQDHYRWADQAIY